MNRIFLIFIIILASSQLYGQKPRARDLGVPFNEQRENSTQLPM